MAFAALIGLGLGTLGGVGVGAAVFPRFKRTSHKHLLEPADYDESYKTPEGGNVSNYMRELARFMAPWTYDPDYSRWVMVNRLVQVMWPTLTSAVLKEVFTQVKPILIGELAKIPSVNYVLEDIVLGEESMLLVEHDDGFCKGKTFSPGTLPPRVAGMKVYHSTEDVCILEVPVMWGGDACFHIGVYLRAGPVRFFIPLEISNIQMKILPRIALEPLVERVPCLGGATISLLEVPTFDCEVKFIKYVDLMALPGVAESIRTAIKVATNLLCVYPNSLSVPVMPNYGVDGVPKGQLNIKLTSINDLKALHHSMRACKPYVIMTCRKGRYVKSVTLQHNKVIDLKDEAFNLIVDDPATQVLTVTIYDDAIGTVDPIMAIAKLEFCTKRIFREEDGQDTVVLEPKDFVAQPLVEKELVIQLYRPLSQAPTGLRKVFSSGSTMVGKAKRSGSKLFSRKKSSDPNVAASESDLVQGPTASELETLQDVLEAEEEEEEEETNEIQKIINKALAGLEDEGEVVLPNLDKPVGTLHCKLTFNPFSNPALEHGDDAPAKKTLSLNLHKANPLPDNLGMPRPPKKQVIPFVDPELKGLLTVTVIKGRNLGDSGSDPYVEFILHDPYNLEREERQLSRVVYNDNSPRWGDKFDYVMVSASSVLEVNVWDKTTLAEGLTSFKVMNKFKDEFLGTVRISAKDVARNGRLRDTWALQQVEQGQIELKLEWQTASVASAST